MSDPIHPTDLQSAEDTALIGRTAFQKSLLKSLAKTIRHVHDVNPNSWSLVLGNPDFLSLIVGDITLMLIHPERATFASSGNLDEEDSQQLQEKNIYLHQGGKNFSLVDVDTSIFDSMIQKYQDQHLSYAAYLAGRVKTRGHWHHRHSQQSVEQIASAIGQPVPAPAYFSFTPTASTGYWRYMTSDETWTDDHEEGCLSSQSWPNPEVDLSQLPKEQASFLEQLKEIADTGLEAARQLWWIAHGLNSNDKIIAHRGWRIVALGTVTGAYEYAPGNPQRIHRRFVRWETAPTGGEWFPKSKARSRVGSGWGLTPISESDYTMLLKPQERNPPQTSDPPVIPIDLSVIRGQFSNEGLTYTDVQVGTFYTALQTKGFVVLSGISGTGKSKIAQGFAAMLPAPDESSTEWTLDPDQVISRDIKPYVPKHHNVVIPTTKRHLLPRMEPDASVYVDTTLLGVTGKARLLNEVMPQGNQVMTLFFRGALREASARLIPGQKLHIVPQLDEDGETLERIDVYTEADQIPSHLALKSGAATEKNSLFLAVRPDWRDSTSLLGYYNPLTETYEWTDFLRFLLRAAESYRQKDGLAWFVILDEMNLAHVEYYFADLLSIIESGRDDDGWSREPIRLTYPDAKTDNPPPHEIYLPPNLYIIGTVNMDETTHAFSPKVLDRAFTIELTDVDFSDYPPSPSDAGAELGDDERTALLDAFTRNSTFAQVSKDDIRQAVEDHPEMRDWLQNLNTGLATHQFHFGYRVFDEIAQFIHNADINEMFDD
jgi:hypothetical protein